MQTTETHHQEITKRVGMWSVKFKVWPADETDTLLNVKRQSLFTGRDNVMALPMSLKEFVNWDDGILIQNALPRLTGDQREFLLTGSTPEEWAEAFAADDEDGEEDD